MDNAKLKGKIAEKGYSIAGLARALGYAYAHLYNKVVGKKGFTVEDASKICDFLKLSKKDRIEIFLDK